MQPERTYVPERGPPSPCTKVCALDLQGFCAGCRRTSAEIGRWLSMTPLEQWELIAELEKRWKAPAGSV